MFEIWRLIAAFFWSVIMQKTQEKIINNNTYVVTQFPATKGIKMLHRLGKYISGPLSKIANSDKGKLLDKEISLENIGVAIQTFFEECDENTFETTVKELLTSTTRNNKPINFDLDYSGNLSELMNILVFIIEVNYKDFFSDIGGLKK